ncbi:MAG: hypothetical protein NZP34_08680 [Caldilineales bacterium]|nr:hypothetical protein [Caldilineales bacterium]
MTNSVVNNVNFGDALPLTLTGVVFDDRNGNGDQDLLEPGVQGAVVEVFADANGNGQIDPGEQLLGSTLSDNQGNYLIPGLKPGSRVVRVQRPGGLSGPTHVPVSLLSRQVGGNTHILNLGLLSATGGIAGTVFFDGNGNGVRDAGEPGLSGVTVQVGALTATTDANGAYVFGGLAPSTYTVVQTDLPGYLSTTPNTLTVEVTNAVVNDVHFGDALPLNLTGVVFDDRNGNGNQDLLEPGVQGAVVEVFADANGNGQIDPGEQLLGSTLSDNQGNYLIPGLKPGPRVVRGQRPGGLGEPTHAPISLISSQTGGNTRLLNLGLLPATVEPAGVGGVVWNDADGDEVVDGGEAPLAGVRLTLLWGPGAIGGVGVVATAVTDGQGRYGWDGLAPDSYQVTVDAASVPAGWLFSGDPVALTFGLANGEHKTLNLGYYDPLLVAPLRLSQWKKEFRGSGRTQYTAAELDGFRQTAERESVVFPEVVPLLDALLRFGHRDEEGARKQYAALRLNLASRRLLPGTPIRLPELTTATTVGQAAAELEGILYPPSAQTRETYRRAEALADALNNGKGIGYNLSGTGRLAQATYNGNNVTTALQTIGGGSVDMQLDKPIHLQRWSLGALSGDINVFDPQVRIRVQTFYDGALLEVRQRLADGGEVSLGVVTPAFWNKDIRATYTFDLWRVSSAADLAGTEVRLYVLDRDGRHKAHIKVDMAEVVFRY